MNNKKKAIDTGRATAQGRTLVLDTFGLKRAEALRPYADIQQDLYTALRADMVLLKEGNDYVSWYNTDTVLDMIAPGWSFEVISNETVGPVHHPEYKNRSGKVFNAYDAWYEKVLVAMTIPAAEGDIVRYGYGMEEYGRFGGDALSTVMSQALRKAAAHHGYARPLWYREEEQRFYDEAPSTPPPPATEDAAAAAVKKLAARAIALMEEGDREKSAAFLRSTSDWVDAWGNSAWQNSADDAVKPLHESMMTAA